MYEGSMVGSGAHVFAVMGYVIAHWRPDETVGGQVRLNPMLLATIFGETSERIQAAIDYLCAPDLKSTTPDEDGRRLVKIGQFDYRVVNASKYAAIRNSEEQREANRIRQANYRAGKEKRFSKKDLKRVRTASESREARAVKADANGEFKEAERIMAEDLPNGI